MAFDYATRASKGARSYQEDAVALSAESDDGPADTTALAGSASNLTAVLADGMGGHAGGALASELACKFFLHSLTSSSGDLPARLNEALDLANAAITREVRDNPSLDGMGCTLVGTAFRPSGVEWVSVGDSPLFLLRKGEIAVLNEDHSLAPEIDKLAEAGKITWAAARSDPRRHFLRSALTGSDIELVDRSERALALAAGDIVILSSDGIHTLSHRDILQVAAHHDADGPGAIADALIAAVADRNQTYQDNTTVIVVKVR